jgi:excisionase family DNA binding protein
MSTLSYRINDFAKLTGIGRTSVYALIKQGQIKPIKIAGRTLIPASEANRLIQEASQ